MRFHVCVVCVCGVYVCMYIVCVCLLILNHECDPLGFTIFHNYKYYNMHCSDVFMFAMFLFAAKQISPRGQKIVVLFLLYCISDEIDLNIFFKCIY